MKNFHLYLIVGTLLILCPSSYAEINDFDYILKGKSVEYALEESIENWNDSKFDNSISSPIVVVAIAEKDISKLTPSTRDEIRTQRFRILENLSGEVEPKCIFIYTVFLSHGDRRINENEKIIGILKKYKEKRKYMLLTAVAYSEKNKTEIVSKISF